MLKKLTTYLAITALLAVLFLPGMVAAGPGQDAVCNGAGLTASGAGTCVPAKGDPTVNSVVVTAVNIFSIVIGLIAVIMIMVAGVKYITSQGDANQVASAKNTLLYAIVGVAIAAMAQIIVKTVLNKIG